MALVLSSALTCATVPVIVTELEPLPETEAPDVPAVTVSVHGSVAMAHSRSRRDERRLSVSTLAPAVSFTRSLRPFGRRTAVPAPGSDTLRRPAFTVQADAQAASTVRLLPRIAATRKVGASAGDAGADGTGGSAGGPCGTTTGSGAITNADARLLIGSGIDVVPISILFNPTLSEWAVTYMDAAVGFVNFPGDYRIRRLTAAGALISDTIFTPDANRSVIPGRFPIATNGQSYFGSVERFYSTIEGSDSYLVKHCPLDATAKAENLTPVTRTPFTFCNCAARQNSVTRRVFPIPASPQMRCALPRPARASLSASLSAAISSVRPTNTGCGTEYERSA